MPEVFIPAFLYNAVHSFSNPEAGSDKSKGAAYDARTAARSWKRMQLFFQEIFPGSK